MTRSLFFLTLLSAAIAAATAIGVRVELAAPGVLAVLQSSAGDAGLIKLEQLRAFHSLASCIAVTILGTALCSAARAKGALWAGFYIWLGWICTLGLAGYAIAAHFAPAPVHEVLSALGAALVVDSHEAGARAGQDPVSVFTAFPTIFAAAMLFLGLYAMVSTVPKFRWLSALGLILTLAISAVAAVSALSAPYSTTSPIYLLLALPLLGCIAIRLIDDAPASLMILAVGLCACIFGQYLLLFRMFGSGPPVLTQPETYQYIFPLGLAFFALPSLIVFTASRKVPPFLIATILGMLLVTLPLWLTSLVGPGLSDAAGSAHNRITTVQILLFIGLYGAGIFALRRAARAECP